VLLFFRGPFAGTSARSESVAWVFSERKNVIRRPFLDSYLRWLIFTMWRYRQFRVTQKGGPIVLFSKLGLCRLRASCPRPMLVTIPPVVLFFLLEFWPLPGRWLTSVIQILANPSAFRHFNTSSFPFPPQLAHRPLADTNCLYKLLFAMEFRSKRQKTYLGPELAGRGGFLKGSPHSPDPYRQCEVGPMAVPPSIKLLAGPTYQGLYPFRGPSTPIVFCAFVAGAL